VAELSLGKFVLVGLTDVYGTQDAAVLTYNADGSLSKAQTWGTSGTDVAYNVSATSDGGFVVTGKAVSDIFVAKYDSGSNLSWSRTWNKDLNDTAMSIKQISDGYIIAGDTFGLSDDDAILIKLDSSGNYVWDTYWGGAGSDAAEDVVQTSDGGFTLTGRTTSYGNGGSSDDIFLAKYSSTGTLSWSRTWGGDKDDYPSSIVQTADGGYAVAGATYGFGAGFGGTAILLLKFDSSGSIAGCVSPMCQSPSPSKKSTISGSVASASITPQFPSAPQTLSVSVSTEPVNTTLILGSPVDVGNPLAPLNEGLDLSTLTPLNLRIAVAVDVAGIDLNDNVFKLQYAIKGGSTSCSTVASGNYIDVTTATPIAYYDGSAHGSGDIITENVNDPSDGSRTMVPQTYQEQNNFTNNASSVYAGQDGMWQFSLTINNNTLKGNNFCLRIYSVTGSSMLTAAHVADVAYAPQMNQLLRNGKWFNRQGILQPHSL
jgi:hypothetical protein